MIRHPLLLAVFAMDLIAVLLMLGSASIAFRTVLHWDPQDASPKQLRREARWETTALAVGWATVLSMASAAILIYALTNILPDVVPGAMCGTGVLESMQTAGPRLLIYRLLAVATLWFWWRVEKANRSLPEAPLVLASARLVLLAMPLTVLSLYAFWQAVLAMDLQQPVDCCAVIYDNFRSLEEARRTLGAGRSVWLTGFGVTSAASALTALAAWRRPLHRRRHLLLALLAAVWLPMAAIVLTRFLSAYHYGVLHHQCPWCLFLPEHRMAGFPVWGAWLVVAMEAFAALGVSLVGGGQTPATALAAGAQAGRAARNSLLGILLFVILAVGPALWWRLTFGMWLSP